MPITYNPTIHRYVREDGSVIPVEEVREIVENIIAAARVSLGDLAAEYLGGRISAKTWQERAAALIKRYHETAAAIARGGYDQMRDADWQAVNATVEAQLGYLQAFVAQVTAGVAEGTPLSDKAVIKRAGFYGDAAWASHSEMERAVMREAGYDLERLLLTNGGAGTVTTCDDCRADSKRGWVAIGTLLPIGQRQCITHCRCRLTYAKSAAQKRAEREGAAK